MQTSRPRPTNQEWLEHKRFIRVAYLVQYLSLRDLVKALESKNFYVTPSQLETKLKKWNFCKNISADAWRVIDAKIVKRKRQDKSSEVIHCGKRVKTSTVEKETDRNRDMSIIAQLQPPSTPPASPINSQLSVCTPASLPMEFQWPCTLPWLTFQLNYSQFISVVSKASAAEAESMDFSSQTCLRSLIATTPKGVSQLRPIDSQLKVSKLAALIGISMPESYHAENLHRAQTLVSGSSEDAIYERLSLIIYKVSNNLFCLEDFDRPDTWVMILDELKRTRILKTNIRLQGLHDVTARCFIEKLFSAAFSWISHSQDYSRETIRSDSFNVLEWCIASGRCVNAIVLSDDFRATPLQIATRNGNVGLVECLLKNGADPHLKGPPLLRGDLEYAFRAVAYNTRGDLIVELLLQQFEASINFDEALFRVIRCHMTQFIEPICRKGANLETALRFDTKPLGFLYEWTALSVAASTGLTETQLILDLLGTKHPTIPIAHFITPDVSISAAAAGRHDTLELLLRLTSTICSTNPKGVTVLHAAAWGGRLNIFKSLLGLGYWDFSTLSTSFLLYLAENNLGKDIMQLFLSNGVDINHATSEYDYSISKLFSSDDNPIALGASPLDIAIRQNRSSNCIATLLEAGARLRVSGLWSVVRSGHASLLLAVLEAGANPNERQNGGESMLQDLASNRYFWWHDSAVALAEILLQHGANFQGGEVVSATGCFHDERMVNLLLSYGGSLLDRNSDGMTLLEAAIIVHKDHVADLVFGEFPQAYDGGSLCAAVFTKAHRMVQRLLVNRPKGIQTSELETTAIGLAAESGDLEILNLLLVYLECSGAALINRGAISNHIAESFETCFDHFDPDSDLDSDDFDDAVSDAFDGFDDTLNDPKNYASHSVYDSPPTWHCSYCQRGSPLAMAARGDQNVHEVSCKLMQAGCKPDRLTWCAASYSNNLCLVELLLERGYRFSTSSTNKDLRLKNPLLFSIRNRNKRMTELLLRAEVDVNRHHLGSPYSLTPLQEAVKLGDLEMIECLLKAGADVNAPAALARGGTALQLVAIMGHLGIAKLLLDRGADVHAPAAKFHGRTALEGAAEHGRIDMLELLIQNGALNGEDKQNQITRAIELAEGRGHMVAADFLRRYQTFEQDED
ncbi:ankyrin repeat-containing domain protein [Mariannaea sp. PMI_226]|nr:ankyrin repeat-containing domain protein [Mariannaea sp. PMI_226]